MVFRWVINLNTKGMMAKHFSKAEDQNLHYFEAECGSDLIEPASRTLGIFMLITKCHQLKIPVHKGIFKFLETGKKQFKRKQDKTLGEAHHSKRTNNQKHIKSVPTPGENACGNHMESPSLLMGTAKAWSLTMSSA